MCRLHVVKYDFSKSEIVVRRFNENSEESVEREMQFEGIDELVSSLS